MFAENMPNDAIRDVIVVDKPGVIRLIFSEKHSVILRQITEKELSISEIARALKLNPGSVHYYLKELEKQGLARQVRQEIKGGIVKKYYRAIARRIVLAGPGFEGRSFQLPGSEGPRGEELVRSIEYLGYRLPGEDREEAKELLISYDRRITEIMKELQSSVQSTEGLEGPEVNPSCRLMVHFRALEDPVLGEIHSKLCMLFIRNSGE